MKKLVSLLLVALMLMGVMLPTALADDDKFTAEIFHSLDMSVDTIVSSDSNRALSAVVLYLEYIGAMGDNFALVDLTGTTYVGKYSDTNLSVYMPIIGGGILELSYYTTSGSTFYYVKTDITEANVKAYASFHESLFPVSGDSIQNAWNALGE